MSNNEKAPLHSCRICHIKKNVTEFYIRESGIPRNECKECNTSLARKRNSLNPEKKALRARVYRKNNREKLSSKAKEYQQKNARRIQEYKASYFQSNKERINEMTLKRRAKDVGFKISGNLRSRLRQALHRRSKRGSAVKDLGCSIDIFIAHIESLFSAGMTWENYGRGLGRWSLDHIRPLILFNLQDKDEVKKACHYTNIAPLWFEENSSKGARYG